MLLIIDVYNAKIKNIEIKRLILPTFSTTNTNFKAKINEVKGKISSITNLTETSPRNAKINEVKSKILNITNLSTTTSLIAVENKTPNLSNLVLKTDYNTNISEIENKITTDHDHDKYITIQEFTKLTVQNFASRLT